MTNCGPKCVGHQPPLCLPLRHVWMSDKVKPLISWRQLSGNWFHCPLPLTCCHLNFFEALRPRPRQQRPKPPWPPWYSRPDVYNVPCFNKLMIQMFWKRGMDALAKIMRTWLKQHFCMLVILSILHYFVGVFFVKIMKFSKQSQNYMQEKLIINFNWSNYLYQYFCIILTPTM